MSDTASPATSPRAAATRSALLQGALEEISAFGVRRSSMQGVARRAGVSRATVYAHWKDKVELFRDLVHTVHDEHVASMERVLAEHGGRFEAQLLAMLEARFLRFVELTSSSPHAAELYDLHGRLCGDIARDSRRRSEDVLERLLDTAAARGDIDLDRLGLDVEHVASVLFDCAHGVKGEDVAPAEFTERLARTVRVLVAGLQPPDPGR